MRWFASLAFFLFMGLLIATLSPTALHADESLPSVDRFDTIVIDAGHGGRDHGARGPGGLMEKEVSLKLALALEKELVARGVKVIMTRRDDTYVPLEQRTSIANDARADLFLSIHANASHDADVDGIETYFLSLQASDEDAQRVADAENMAFETAEERAPVPEDPLFHILGDMMETEHLMESSEFAGLAQTKMGALEKGSSRGVKQAPFVVLMGVQMPASLLEVGFISNPMEEKKLRSKKHQGELVAAILVSVEEFGQRYDARRGIR
jgi:N-acetylmuramoyl-L-alanine amidase